MNFWMLGWRYLGSSDPAPSRVFGLPRARIDEFSSVNNPTRRARGNVKAAKGSKVYGPGFRRLKKLYYKGL